MNRFCTKPILPDEQTDAENLLRYLLGEGKLLGHSFHRKSVIGPYVVDFYYPEKKLAIELIGSHQNSSDFRYKEFLRNEGIRLLQFHSDEVFNRTADVIRQIEEFLT